MITVWSVVDGGYDEYVARSADKHGGTERAGMEGELGYCNCRPPSRRGLLTASVPVCYLAVCAPESSFRHHLAAISEACFDRATTSKSEFVGRLYSVHAVHVGFRSAIEAAGRSGRRTSGQNSRLEPSGREPRGQSAVTWSPAQLEVAVSLTHCLAGETPGGSRPLLLLTYPHSVVQLLWLCALEPKWT